MRGAAFICLLLSPCAALAQHPADVAAEAFAETLRSETVKWARVVQAAGIKAE